MKNETEKNQQNELKAVSVFVDENGKKWVRVRTIDLDFKIDLHDYKEFNKSVFTWYELTERADLGKIRMVDKKMAKAIYLYIDEINATLNEAGGEELDGWYCTVTECPYYHNHIWVFFGNKGCLDTGGKGRAYRCRSIASCI